MGDAHEDFEATEVVSTEKRRVGSECESIDFTKARQERIIKLEAMRILKDRGWAQERIAIAVGYTDRHVRRLKAKVGLARQLAEAYGRV